MDDRGVGGDDRGVGGMIGVLGGMIGALWGMIGVIMMRTMIMNLVHKVPKQAIKASSWWWLWWHGVLTQ